MKTFRNTQQKAFKGFLLLMLCFAFLGCKKYFDPPDVFEEQTVVNIKKRKVLLVVLDGVTGADLKTIAPPKLQSILPKSKYSYNGLADMPVSDAGSWKNIMTGVNVSTHGVIDDTFDRAFGGVGNEHDAQVTYPTFVERLQASGKMRFSSAITTWPKLSEKLMVYADDPIVVANDALVKDSTLKKLAEPNMDLVISNFSAANQAGLTYGYSADVNEYKDAILQIDTYIGQLLDGIKARKDYAKEDWMVIITSTHGGDGKSFTTNPKRDRNIFTIYHHPDFKGAEILPLSVTDGLGLTTKDVLATLPAANASSYNFGATGDFTVQFKILLKSKPNSTTSHSVLLSKVSHAYTSINGWEFMLDAASSRFRVLVGSGTTASMKYIYSSTAPSLNIWCSVALKIYSEGAVRYARLYLDGKPGDAVDITGVNIGNTATSLIAGAIPSSLGTCSQVLSNIAIYNTALSNDAISNFVCQEEITATDPYYLNLIGYWPANDASGNLIKNKSPLAIGKDMTIATTGTASYAWSTLGAWSCIVPPAGTKVLLMQNTDISQQIYYWFGVKIDAKWVTNGKVWLSDFESEFIK